jgi:pimeloyl-ACP methyl ester carboxylesterase
MRLFALILAATLGAIVYATPARAAVPTRTVAPLETFDVGMLQVERFGTPGRQAIVFIPALFCGSWQWNGQVAELAATHDIYVVTLPGFDGRKRDRGGNLMNRAAADISKLIHTRRIGPAIVVGHSLGGTLAVLFAEEYPQDVRGLIAVEGGYPVAPTAAARARQSAQQAQPYDGADPKKFDRVLRTTMLQYVITKKADVDTVARLGERSDPSAIADWLRAAFVLDLTPHLNEIAAPFLEIVPFDASIDPYVGYKTLDAKRKTYETWVAHAKHGGVVAIDRSRHFVMFDQPAAFNRELAAAIDAESARR